MSSNGNGNVKDSFTKFHITYPDGSAVDPNAAYYVLKLTGNTAHAAACRHALTVYAERIAPIMPVSASECRRMIADEARKADQPIDEPAYVASADGEDFKHKYPDRETAILRAPHDLNIAPGGTYWIGYLAPLMITGDVTWYMTDLVNTLAEQGHPVSALVSLVGNGSMSDADQSAADARLEVLAQMLSPVIRQWASHYGVDLSNLWGVTGVEQCTRPVPA